MDGKTLKFRPINLTTARLPLWLTAQKRKSKPIIEDASKTKSKPGNSEQKIGDLYASFMDTDTIETKGLAPIKADLSAITALADHTAAASMMGNPSLDLNSIVGGWVNVDAKDTKKLYFLYDAIWPWHA